CDPAHNTSEGVFVGSKGLKVNDLFRPLLVTDVAYVLISHGENGLGGFTTAGQQKPPVTASADEVSNMAIPGPTTTYVAKPFAVDFDDLITYVRVGELIQVAGLGGRLWATPP